MAAPAPSPLASAPRAGLSSRRQLLLLVNPRASRSDDARLAAALGTLRDAFSVKVSLTEERGHAAHLAREAAADGFELVAAAGGDGTFSETADGLAGSGTAMACLPTGCTNVFARAIGTPREPVRAAEHLAALERGGRLVPRQVDMGTVNGRHFVFTSGVGFSASMTASGDASPERKARLGQLHFASAAASELARTYLRDPPQMRVEAGGRTATGVTVVVQNARALTYFGPREIHACGAAGLESGAISLMLLRRARPRDVAPVLLRLLARRIDGHPEVEGFGPLEAATVVSGDGRPLPLEADGEFLGHHRCIRYGVAPGALKIVGHRRPRGQRAMA